MKSLGNGIYIFRIDKCIKKFDQENLVGRSLSKIRAHGEKDYDEVNLTK
jgi:hypothetical protein